MLHTAQTPTRNVFKVTTKTSKGPLVVVFPPTPPSIHAVRSADTPYPGSYTSEHGPSDVPPQSEPASSISSKVTKDHSISPGGSGGEKDPGPDSAILAPLGESLISTSPLSSFHSSPPSSSLWPILRFDGHTTHGPVYVDLPPTFEGHFTLRTSNRHQPRLVFKKRDGSDKGAENIDGVDLVRRVIDAVSGEGEVIKGTIQLVSAGSEKSESSSTGFDASSEEQSPTLGVPLSKNRPEDGTVNVPVAWVNVWTTNNRVELWV